MEPFYVFVEFFLSPHLLQLLRIMLQHCFAVKPQKYFVDNETSPDLPLAWGWLDDEIKLLGELFL